MRRDIWKNAGASGRAAVFVLLMAAALIVWGCGAAGGGGDGGEVPGTALTVAEAVARGDADSVRVTGLLLSTGGVTRLCDALAESYPPQCGGDSLLLEGVDADAVVGLSRTTSDSSVTPAAWSDFPVTLTGSLSGDVLVVTEAPRVVAESRQGSALVRFAYSPDPASSGGTVYWRLEVRNEGAEPMSLTFGSGQRGDATLSAGGSEVYRWSADKAFTQAIEEVTLAPGEALGIVLGDPLALEPADYEARAWVTGTTSDGGRLPELTGTVTVR